MTTKARAPLGEAAFRRNVAHALSTPLGSLLLKTELVDHYLRHDKVQQARDAVSALLLDFEQFGREFRSVFAAIADVAEDGGGVAEPRVCLQEALADLGADVVGVVYTGDAALVAIPAPALTALMRRIAMVGTARGGGDVQMVATAEAGQLLLSLHGRVGMPLSARPASFSGNTELHLAVAREIAARFGGRLEERGENEVLLRLALPMAR